ncbi:hypothetical protein NP233_g3970 [Leucocoprinus birnbaumii]|uniref:Cytochrome P450 n=1 Tax=Leucocoprinus birnbaumii TaxID=56174 RepID=A0AAD5VY87_9AGAR|nr:hypothetical protein NP233_g3970 [Leucocoprinus birnbaumii]
MRPTWFSRVRTSNPHIQVNLDRKSTSQSSLLIGDVAAVDPPIRLQSWEARPLRRKWISSSRRTRQTSEGTDETAITRRWIEEPVADPCTDSDSCSSVLRPEGFFMAGIPSWLASLLAILLESMFYGFFVLLYVINLVAANGEKKIPLYRQRWLLVSTLMLALATAHLVIAFVWAVHGFEPMDGKMQDERFGMLSEPLYRAKIAIYFMQTILADSLMVSYLGAPFIKTLTAPLAVLVVRLLPAQQPANTDPLGINGLIPLGCRIAFMSTTMVLHLTCSTAIVIRMYLVRRELGFRAHTISPVVIAIIESAVLYTIAVFLLLLSNLLDSFGQFVVMDMIVPLVYRIFKIPRYTGWLVLVNGPEYLEDIRKAGTKLSFPEALNKAGQFDYTISPGLKEDLIHINVVRGPMTRNIGARFPDLDDELGKTLNALVGEGSREWVSIPCYLSAVRIISRLSARFFAGPRLSANPRYTEIMQSYAFHLIKGGFLISLFPECLKSFVGRVLFDSQGRIREVENYLRPIFNEHVEKGMDGRYDTDLNDMITWLWNASPESQRNLHDIAIRMIYLNVAAIHTTSNLLTHVLLSIATHTSYIEGIREEIYAAVALEGWTKGAIEKLPKLDSFVKESQRLYGGDAAMIVRQAMDDFTFTDGTFIPRGTSLAVTGRAINQDEHSYPRPKEFQGFRFVDKDPLKWQMTALNPEFMTYGIGRHACPGRFFAVTEVKTVVAKILMEFDIKLADNESNRPKDKWMTGIFIAPNKSAKIMLKRRADTKAV